MEVIPGQFESKVGFCLKKPSVVPWKYFAKLLACLGVLLRGLVFQNYCVKVIQAAIVKIRFYFFSFSPPELFGVAFGSHFGPLG